MIPWIRARNKTQPPAHFKIEVGPTRGKILVSCLFPNARPTHFSCWRIGLFSPGFNYHIVTPGSRSSLGNISSIGTKPLSAPSLLFYCSAFWEVSRWYE